MHIRVKGASEHNLRGVNVEFGDGLTVVTGVSGSGKTSLVFDTLYHESRRRFLDVFSTGSSALRLSPAKVDSIQGLGPAIAVGQNLLNRNPGSTLATASGLHPFLRLLYARFGQRHCPRCGAGVQVLAEDEIVEYLVRASERGPLTVFAPLVRGARGSHRTLLRHLCDEFGIESLRVDNCAWSGKPLQPYAAHDIDLQLKQFTGQLTATQARPFLELAWSVGAYAVIVQTAEGEQVLSRAAVCTNCGSWLGRLEPVHFNTSCPYCKGKGCEHCGATGLHPEAAAVRWTGLSLPDLSQLSVDQARALFAATALPRAAARLEEEIRRRLDTLERVGLGYISLDRPSPTLSRGESQRVRLAVTLTSRLEDMLHVLDEPTIGQHPADTARLLSSFRDLLGPVVFVEHDRAAAAAADRAIDLGPGAGEQGGEVVFSGTPDGLWRADTATGRYFSLRERVSVPEARPEPDDFLIVRRAHLRNLCNIDVAIPLRRLTVITGVSGSGKSTFVEDVLAASLSSGSPVGCASIEGPAMRAVIVDQSPIGRNPRSNPATYTKLSDIIRDYFAASTGLSPSHFSFNRSEGACPTCSGLGAIEIKMRYLPSTWILCVDCDGQRFSDEVLAAQASFDDQRLSIADLYKMSITEAASLLVGTLPVGRDRRSASRLLRALLDIGLGYLRLGQPSPTLSGGEAQRVKLAKFLGRRSLVGNIFILDEPSTGLHPKDVAGLLRVLDRLVRSKATVLVVEHNTDVIRAADWVIDLGPGAGPLGGRVLYAGPLRGLLKEGDSLTGQALADETQIEPCTSGVKKGFSYQNWISIRGARANNLQAVDVDLPRNALTVITGVSGSGKSSLVGDVLEAEARRRFLESLSMYERQSTHEGPEAPVDAISGLGVALSVTPERRMHARRATVGTVTEVAHHLAALLAWAGSRHCLDCGVTMMRPIGGSIRDQKWTCPDCGATAPLAQPRHFDPSTYAAACLTCHGIGTLRKPNPGKLIIHPDRPLCDGAMYSPGFFPQGYLCKPYNGGYYEVQALAARYAFDPATTPWNEMSDEAQRAFLFGDAEPLKVRFESRTGRTHTRTSRFPGFYGWVRDWDVGGTYTDTQLCPECGGSKLRSQYAAVRLGGHNLHGLSEMPLSDLEDVLSHLDIELPEITEPSLRTALARLRFLSQVGLGYISLNRSVSTLSAGEAQRIKVAGLLGSGLTALTLLLDEPSRGLHPSEVGALADVLTTLRDQGNTVVVVEHDLELIRAADYVIDIGPGAGGAGGQIVARGTPGEVAQTRTLTAVWLSEAQPAVNRRRWEPKGWMTIRGARANNLRGGDVHFPLGVLVGVCGVSGSGKRLPLP